MRTHFTKQERQERGKGSPRNTKQQRRAPTTEPRLLVVTPGCRSLPYGKCFTSRGSVVLGGAVQSPRPTTDVKREYCKSSGESV